MAGGKLSWWHVALVVGMLVTGSTNTLSKKLAYDSTARGLDGTVKKWDKPWTCTLVMFLGEAMCMLFFLNRVRASRSRGKRKGLETEPLLDVATHASMNSAGGDGGAAVGGRRASADHTHVEGTVPSASSWCVCLLPALCDVGGTTVSGIGLLFTSASVFQMLRGSIIVFAALLSVAFLDRKLYAFHWSGLFLTVVGISVVGVSSYMHASGSNKPGGGHLEMLGNVLVIGSQLLSAVQMVVEEKYLKGRNLPSEFVVGAEGCFGVLLMVFIMLPITYFLPGKDGDGVHENAIDAFVMLGNNMGLLITVLLYWCSIAFYNFFGLSVAKSLSSVHRTLIDACRTTLVWSIDIVSRAAAPMHRQARLAVPAGAALTHVNPRRCCRRSRRESTTSGETRSTASSG